MHNGPKRIREIAKAMVALIDEYERGNGRWAYDVKYEIGNDLEQIEEAMLEWVKEIEDDPEEL